MPNEIGRLKINWTGFTGAPGFTNLYFNDFTDGNLTQAMVDGFRSRVDTLLGTVQGRIPGTVTIAVDPVIDVIDVPTGDLTRFMTTTPAAARVGQGTGNYSAASGGVINWYTAGVRLGRRIRGRTFIVPYASSALGPNGTLDDTLRTSMLSALTTFTGAGANQGLIGVYARPMKAHTNKAGDPIPAQPGVWYPVTSFTHPDKVAVLRSRRD